MSLPSHTSLRIIRHLLGHPRSRVALCFLLGLVGMALLADVLANDRPILTYSQHQLQFPLFHGPFYGVEWDKMTFDFELWPLVPHGVEVQDNDFPHLLKTDLFGRDVLACLIHGSRVSLWVGVGTISVALLLGILLGGISGYYGNTGISLNIIRFGSWLVGGSLAFYYGIFIRRALWGVGSQAQIWLSLAWVLALLVVSDRLGYLLSRTWKKSFRFPVDAYISRLIEWIDALPTLLIVIALSAVFVQNFGGKYESGTPILPLILILGSLSWTAIARLVRSEVIRIKSLEYIAAAQGLGIPPWQILRRHILPNGLAPLWVIGAFGVGRAIMAEATLSFLGLGPAHAISWGKLLYVRSVEEIRAAPLEMLLFPGLMIFLTVLSCNILGERLRDIIDPKHNSS